MKERNSFIQAVGINRKINLLWCIHMDWLLVKWTDLPFLQFFFIQNNLFHPRLVKNWSSIEELSIYRKSCCPFFPSKLYISELLKYYELRWCFVYMWLFIFNFFFFVLSIDRKKYTLCHLFHTFWHQVDLLLGIESIY